MKAANDALEEIESFARAYGNPACGSVEAVRRHMQLCPRRAGARILGGRAARGRKGWKTWTTSTGSTTASAASCRCRRSDQAAQEYPTAWRRRRRTAASSCACTGP